MTRLGASADLRKAGRYARTMGTAWRHVRREQISFAANGLLSDIWSYCADQAVDHVTVAAMRKLTAPDAKNAARMTAQLVQAGYLVPMIGGGWKVHNWAEHNPVAGAVKLHVVPQEASLTEGGLRGGSEGAERRAPRGIIEDANAVLKTQDPIKTSSPKGEDRHPAECRSRGHEPKPPAPSDESTAETEQQIAALEAAYGAPDLLRATRASCALWRSHGRMSPRIWLHTLRRLAQLDKTSVLHALHVFVSRYGDGDRNEKYLLGIARNTAKSFGHGRMRPLRSVEPDPSQEPSPEAAANELRMRQWLGLEAS